ncbi:multicopper oxidase family protein [Campylobacter subantarcticus]|uniref:Copper oxidase n=1 Tax=Campylobacter subantarcticus LMG 24374 TaxID=1388751 RepID=A0A0A8H8G1_9BACT|nr:multicopper oxidase family protein [Campylobacter subantarcticus]AJC90267.1 copper oxidase [Campylobacter subantarcticus LMG 24374]EAJ1261254.1 multicopper oxidase family protein [Campylobacter lari]
MNRRLFLKWNALGLASISSAYAMSDHSRHDMHSHHTAKKTQKIDTSFIKLEDPNIQLLDIKDFPSEEVLANLKLLKNTSTKKNFFRSSIEIKESQIELVKGKKTKCFTYNGSIPGPKIEVYEGDTVEILVKNNLKEPTTIHWHGLDIPPEQDGNPHDPIMPGRERIYRFKLGTNSAGTYWYHPHPHYTTAKQVYKGLAGVFVVKAKKDALSHLQEQDWVISDLRLDKNAQIPDNNLFDWLNGREGNLVLINGQLKPKITIDDAQRIRIYNLCAARYLNLRIQGAKFILVGTDGGLIEKGIELDELFLSPASRVEVLIQASKGDFKLESTYYNRDKMLVEEKPYTLTLADLKVEKTLENIPEKLREFPPLKETTSFKEVIMSEDHMQMHGISNKSEEEIKQSLASMFLINGKTFDMNRTDLTSKLNEVEEWVVKNSSHMDHPFHIHGTQFELISSQFKGKITKAKFRALQDTINVRPGEELRLRMSQNFTGIRMFHCHILEHEDLGMMGILKIKE